LAVNAAQMYQNTQER